MRHIDLVEKEVLGVIDHADGSVTREKLSDPVLCWKIPPVLILAIWNKTGGVPWTNLFLVGDVPADAQAALLLIYAENISNQAGAISWFRVRNIDIEEAQPPGVTLAIATANFGNFADQGEFWLPVQPILTLQYMIGTWLTITADYRIYLRGYIV